MPWSDDFAYTGGHQITYTVGMEEIAILQTTADKIAAVAGLDLVVEGRDTASGHKTVEDICPFFAGRLLRVTGPQALQSMFDGFTLPRLLGETLRDVVREVGAEQAARVSVQAQIVHGSVLVSLALFTDVNTEPLVVKVYDGSISETEAMSVTADARRRPLPYTTTVGSLHVEVSQLVQVDNDGLSDQELEDVYRGISADLGFEPLGEDIAASPVTQPKPDPMEAVVDRGGRLTAEGVLKFARALGANIDPNIIWEDARPMYVVGRADEVPAPDPGEVVRHKCEVCLPYADLEVDGTMDALFHRIGEVARTLGLHRIGPQVTLEVARDISRQEITAVATFAGSDGSRYF